MADTKLPDPFAAGVYHGVQTYTIDVADRLRMVKNFTLAQCEAALQVEGLQKTVEAAVRARIRRLEKEATMRSCDAIGCTTAVGNGKFLCLGHWRAVPRDVQDTITQRYWKLRRDFSFLSDPAYLQACVDAIEGIARAEGRAVVPTSYHRLLTAANRKATA